MLLAANPIGVEFQVNSETAASQTISAIAMDADGDYVVAWQSNLQDGSGYGIYAQRYNAAGIQQGTEFLVNTATANNQGFPSVAMDADGDFVVAWLSSYQDGSFDGIYAQRYNAVGVAQGGEFLVNTFTASSQIRPSVAMDADGDFVIAWSSNGQDGDAHGIYAQRYSAAGATLGGEFQVNTTVANSQRNPSVAMDGDGDFVVTWQSYAQDGSSYGIYAQRYNGAGVTQGSEFQVNTFTTGDQTFPSIAMDADGDFIVAWQSDGQDGSIDGIYARRFNTAAEPQGLEFRVNTFTTDAQRNPSAAMDTDGDFVVTWESYQDGDVNGIYGKQYNAAGVVQGGEFRVNSETADEQRNATVALDADGDFVVVWDSVSQDGSNSGVYTQRYNETTETAGPIVSAVLDSDRQIAPGGRLTSTLDSLTVVFSEDLNVVGGASGANSVLNFANWRLTKDGVDVSNQIASVTFDFNDLTRKYEVELNFVTTLTAGTYRLTALAAIRDIAGNSLDGDLNGSPGGDYKHSFAISNILAAGNETRVNTFTTNAQRDPTTAMDADGDYVVVWTGSSQDGSGYGIYAQRYNAAGVRQESEFRVNTFTTGGQVAPSVAMDADGDFVITWQGDDQDGSSTGIYAQRYNAAGVTQGSEFRVNTFTTDGQSIPTVAMDADGDFVVTWRSSNQDGSGYGIYAQRYNATGVTQGSEFRVNTVTTNDQRAPSVAMDADGDFVVTWTSNGQDGDFDGIYAQRYNAAGVTQGSEFRVNTVTTNIQRVPSVAMDADGDFVVTWTSNGQDGDFYGIYAQRYNAAGVTQGSEFHVNTFKLNNQFNPSVAMDADGEFVVTWQSIFQDGDFYGIYAQRYNAAGVTQGSEFRVNTFTTSSQSRPSVAMDADGDFVVAWQSYAQDGSSFGIYAQRYQSDAPVQLANGGVLTVDGTNLADSISLERVTPAGAAPQLNVVRNGVNYAFDASKVLVISVNGQSGDDTLSIGSTVTTGATLNGGGGNDRLIGGGGNDVLLGGAGNDTYVFDTDTALGSDTISDIGGGIDTLDFSETTTLNVVANLGSGFTQGVNGNLSLNLSSEVTIENVIGSGQSDILIGNARPNAITGGGGSDIMSGGSGNDRYIFDTDLAQGNDTISESGGGIDTLDFGATSTKPVVIDLSNAASQTVTASNLSLTLSAGNTIENVIGGSFKNTFTGNSLNNRFTGGAGTDSYRFDTDTPQGRDVIVETGAGVDTVDFSSTGSLGVTVNLATAIAQVVNANLTLALTSGVMIENVTGGNQGDTLTGNTLNNVLSGRGGIDTLSGSSGDDTYVFDTDLALGSDTITDTAGVDTLDFGLTTTRGVTVDLSLTSAQVVNAGLTLTLTSATSMNNVIGGDLSDTLTGNTLGNVITGGLGNDVLTGGAGNDTYLFDTDLILGLDTINESGGGIDTLDFSPTTTKAIAVNLSSAANQLVTASNLNLILSAGNTLENVIGGSLGDTLTGNTLDNRLTGGPGSDTLVGAAGNDTYLFDTDLVQGSDTINESGGGIDTLDFSATTTKSIAVNLSSAAAQVVTASRLTLTLSAGNTIEAVIGGALADSLTGNTLNNILTGGGGNDTLTGSSGNDSFLFDTDLALGTDTINDSGGIDTLNFSPTTTQSVTVDLSLATVQVINANLSLNLQSATTIENAIGGSLNDSLTGNTLANALTGRAGNDALAGGSGNDSYIFDTDTALGTDTIIEFAVGGGVDTLDFSTTTTVGVEVSLSLASAQVVNANLTLILSAGNSIENASGGSLDDILIGNTLENSLQGNAGDDVLSGLAGNDTLIGGPGKNLLFGGFGADMLTGGTSEDLMLGARYLLENDIDALGSLRAEWVSASNFNNRVGHLLGTIAGGLNNGFTLNQATVKEDFSPDTLTGGTGRDWYLRNALGAVVPLRDTLVDADVDSVFEEISNWL